MPRWSITLFQVFRIPLRVHASFLLIPIYMGALGWRSDGWTGILWGLASCLLIASCVTMHELGHALTARRHGIETNRILLMVFGGVAVFDRPPESARSEILITIAGPAVNFAWVAILFIALPNRFWEGPIYFPANVLELAELAFYCNLGMGLFNLIPIFPMDGGRLLRAGLSYKFGFRGATRFTASLGMVLAISLALYVLVAFRDVFLAGLLAFIVFANRMEMRASA